MANKFSISQSPEDGNIYVHSGSSLTIAITVNPGTGSLYLKTK